MTILAQFVKHNTLFVSCIYLSKQFKSYSENDNQIT